MSKNKSLANAPPTTRTSLASKLATMVSTGKLEEASANNDSGSMSQLVTELTKQQASIKEDISTLIEDLIVPLQVSVNTLTETVMGFQSCLCATESLAGDNFSTLAAADSMIKTLQAQNATLLDRVDDLENWSQKENLKCTVNVPENSEKGHLTFKFVSEMIMEVMGQEVFEKPPELERAHQALSPRHRKYNLLVLWLCVCIYSRRRKEHSGGPDNMR